jgi:HPt (histidine-containing phosphotransfer) domain-containing protein
MDEYLSKPIGAGELKGILDRLVFAECPSLPLDAPALDAPALEAPALEVPAQSARSEESADMNPHDAAFDREDLIDRMMGNEDVARRVVNRFVTDMPAQLMALSKAIADTDHDKTHLLAHSIKGAASNVSGRAVTRAAAEIEAAARNGDMLRAEGVLPGLTVEFDRLNAAFCEFLASA